MSGERGSFATRAYTAPMLHEHVPMSIPIEPRTFAFSKSNPCGATNNAMPLTPNSIPKAVRLLTTASFVKIGSNTAIHSGSEAMSNAATPEGTVFCAHASTPCPTRKNRNPISINEGSSRRLTFASPRKRPHAYSAEPAMSERMPIIMNGGNDSIAYLMARYVVPQTKYIAMKAARSFSLLGWSEVIYSVIPNIMKYVSP